MKKSTILFVFALCLIQASATITVSLGGVDHTMDTIAHYQVGPGTWYTQVHFVQLNGTFPLDVFIVQTDATNQYISFESVIANDELYTISKGLSNQTERPSNMAKRHSSAGHHLIAGTNGDFFTTGSTNIVEGTSCAIHGRPSAGTIVNHQIATLQPNNRQTFAVDDKNYPYIGTFTRHMYALVKGDTLEINNVNYTRSKNKLTLFNSMNGDITTSATDGIEVLLALKEGETWGINKDVVLVVENTERNNGGMAIPDGKVVLSGNGTMATALNVLAVGDEVTVNLDLALDNQKADWFGGVGGNNTSEYAPMVHNGITETEREWGSREPRTGIGYSVTRDTVIMCVVDGRGKSKGVSTRMEGDIMKLFGAYEAMNLDGGGSSCLYLEAYGKPMNNGSDGSERACGNGFFTVCTAPDDAAIARIEPFEHTIKAPIYGATLIHFLGYNQYDYLLDTDVQGVVLSCDPSVGEVLADGSFMAKGNGKLTAKLGDVTTTLDVIIDNNAQVGFLHDSVLVSDDTDYSLEVTGVVGLNTFTLNPVVLSYEFSDSDIAMVTEAGHLFGLKNGRTLLYATLGDFKDTLIVNVEIPESKPLLWNKMLPGGDWNFSASNSAWNTQYTTNANGNAQIDLTYTSGRNPNIKFFIGEDETDELEIPMYSLPTTIELRINNTLPLGTITAGIRANNAQLPIGAKAENLTTGKQNVLLSIDSVFADSKSIAFFPLYLRYITFAIDGAVKNTAYSMEIEGIFLHYGELLLGLENIERNAQSKDGLTHIFDMMGRELLITETYSETMLRSFPQGLYIVQTPSETMKVRRY